MAKRLTASKPGDVVAVPRHKGGFYFVLHLASNRFGEAFGLFQGHNEVPNVSSDWKPLPLLTYAYTGNYFIKSGRWIKVGQRDDLRRLFPPTPEIFHSKSDNLSNPAIGPYGSAETPEGELRHLTLQEATDIGMMSNDYRQVMVEEEFERYLNNTLD